MSRRRDARRNQKAFSLIELMLVVGIIGIMATIAIPKYDRFICTAKAKAVAACGKAVREDYTHRWQPNSSNEDFMAAGGSATCQDRLAKRCIMDVNNDGRLDITDYNILLSLLNSFDSVDLGATLNPKYTYDQNGNGIISLLDLLVIVNALNDPTTRKSY